MNECSLLYHSNKTFTCCWPTQQSKAKHSTAQWLKVRIRNRPLHTCRWRRTQKRKLFDVASSKWHEQQVETKLYDNTQLNKKTDEWERVQECNRHYMKSVYPFYLSAFNRLKCRKKCVFLSCVALFNFFFFFQFLCSFLCCNFLFRY